jgi:hypothetical protein
VKLYAYENNCNNLPHTVMHQLLNMLRRDQLSSLLDDGGPKAVMRSRQKSQTPRHQLLKLLKRLVCTDAAQHVHKNAAQHTNTTTWLNPL